MFDNFKKECVLVGGFGLKDFKDAILEKRGQELILAYDGEEKKYNIDMIENIEEIGEVTYRERIFRGELPGDGYVKTLIHDTFYRESMDNIELSFTFLVIRVLGEEFVIRVSGTVGILKKLGFWKYKYIEDVRNMEVEKEFYEAIEKAKKSLETLSGVYLGGTNEFVKRQIHIIYMTEDEIIIDRQQIFKRSSVELVIKKIKYSQIEKVELVEFEEALQEGMIPTKGYFGLLELIGRMNADKYKDAYNDRRLLKITYKEGEIERAYLMDVNRSSKKEREFLLSKIG